MADGRWAEVGDGVFARRYAELDLTVGLVVGGTGCLVVDTRGDAEQGAELAAAVREVTALPWTVALTHAHFDHAFGTAAFVPCDVWAHEGCRAALTAKISPGIVLPGSLVSHTAELSLGDRRVVLTHLGPAHTDHDLVVRVPDAGVVFAGDLVEHAPGGSFTAESFGSDTTLGAWPSALDGLLALEPRVVVPGHGEPVGPGFVAELREPLARLVELCDGVESGELTREEAKDRSPFPADVTEAALLSRSSAHPSEPDD